jgi:predicted transposase YdaD
MALPEALEKQFQTELKIFEEARQMKYVTTIERMAEERGEARGARSRETEIALNLLRKNMPLETIAEVTGLTIEQIQELQTQPSE